MTANIKSKFHKLTIVKRFALVSILLFFTGLFTACDSIVTDREQEEYQSSLIVNPPQLPLEQWDSQYLYGDIPAPTAGEVYVLTNITDDKRHHYSFTIEGFSLQDTKEYIKVLETSMVIRDYYDVYYEKDFPMLNYIGHTKDGIGITISQCNTSGGIGIHVEKEE